MESIHNTAFIPTTERPSPWPFHAPPALRTKVSDHGVGVPARQEVEFKDGQRIALLRVMTAGAPDLYLRDLGEPAAGQRIDLRHLVPHVEVELPTTSTRDVAGYVHYSLRGLFETREVFLDAAAREAGRA